MESGSLVSVFLTNRFANENNKNLGDWHVGHLGSTSLPRWNRNNTWIWLPMTAVPFQGGQRKAQRRWWRREACGGHRDVTVGRQEANSQRNQRSYFLDFNPASSIVMTEFNCLRSRFQSFKHLEKSIGLNKKYMAKLILFCLISMSNVQDGW